MRKAFICPGKYVQGENELLNLGYFIRAYGDSALVIAHSDDVSRVKEQLDMTAEKYKVTFVESGFQGECSRQEVARLQQIASEKKCSCIVGLGGGKAIDTAKCVAEGEALIIVPTIAATDAPTSHSAVLYTPEGGFDDYIFFKSSPQVVLIDSTVIAKAPTRFLISGMGDALATYFEARASAGSYSNVNAGLLCGVREGVAAGAKGTLTAMALATLCYETLLEDGKKAIEACEVNKVTPAFENIIEANILLSGLGFESGGLAAAHAIHNGLTLLDGTHDYYHGEKVAFGTVAQLVLENTDKCELEEVLDFCVSVGLPVCLKDIGVDALSDKELMEVAKKACAPEESIHTMPFPVIAADVAAAIATADRIGAHYKENEGL